MGLYPVGGGGGGGLISGIKKKSFETSHGSLDQNTFFKLKVVIKQHLALSSAVIQQRGAYNRMYFFVSR